MLRRQGRGKQPALKALAAHADQKLQLLLGFHTFGHHLQPQRTGQRVDGSADLAVVHVHHDVAHKHLVDLQLAHRQALELDERRVAGAKVVNRQRKTRVLQLQRDGVQRLVQQLRLGDLQHQAGGRDPGTLGHIQQGLGEARLAQLDGGNVDRHHGHLPALGTPLRHLAAGGLEHPQPDGHDEPALLGQRDELVGRHRLAVHRPAQQRLGAHGLALLVELGLVDQRELARLQRVVQAPAQLQPPARDLRELFDVEAVRAAPRTFGGMQGRMRVAHQLHAVGGVVRVQADAQAGAHVLRAHLRQLPRLRQAFHQRGRQLRQLGARRGAQQHHRELVIGQPRHQALPRQQLGDALGHLAQQRIAHAVAVGFVHALEVVQVDQQQRHAAVGAVRVARGLGHGALQRVFKVAAVGQAGERVKVRHAVQLLLVAQHGGLGRAQAVEQAHHNGLPQRGQQQHQQAARQDQCLHARPPIGRHKKQHQRDGRQRHGQQRHVVHGLVALAAIGRICRHGKPQRARTPAEYQRRHREAGVEPDARLHRAADDHEVPLHPAQAIAQQAQQHQHVRTLDAHPHRRNGQRRDARRSQKPGRVQHQHRAHGQRVHPARG